MSSEPTDEPAFIAAIIASPDDDLPRLVFADWLDEHTSGPCRACSGTGWAYKPWKGDAASHHPTAFLMYPADNFGPEGQPMYRNKCETCHGAKTADNGNAARSEFICVQVELAKLHRQPCSVASGAWVGPLRSGRGHVAEWPNSPPGRCAMPLNEFGGGLCRKCEAIPRLQRREEKLWNAGYIADGAFHGTGPLYTLMKDNPGIVPTLSRPHGMATETYAIVRRGFIDEVQTTLASWCGGECGRCGGTGLIGEERRACPGCPGMLGPIPGYGGTGRVSAIGPRVVRSHPVTRVVLTDVVTRSAVSDMGRVTRESAGDLYYLAFPTAVSEHVEGNADAMERRISLVALAWAKSQNPPTVADTARLADSITDYTDGLTREIARGLGVPAELLTGSPGE